MVYLEGLVSVYDGAEADGDGDQHYAIYQPVHHSSGVLGTVLAPRAAGILATGHAVWVRLGVGSGMWVVGCGMRDVGCWSAVCWEVGSREAGR
jgi:hypothetical protein